MLLPAADMNVTSAPPASVDVDIVHDIEIISMTKDSLHIGWDIFDEYISNVRGYKVQYRAVGSQVVQYSHELKPTVKDLDIQQLHENTYYNICVQVIANITVNNQKCLKASTATDSLSVALGSTFGAFLTLGIIVLFVFLAKYQHTRKLQKQMHQVTPGDSYETGDPNEYYDPDIEMSDVSLQVHEDTIRLENESRSSQYSNTNRDSIVNGMIEHTGELLDLNFADDDDSMDKIDNTGVIITDVTNEMDTDVTNNSKPNSPITNGVSNSVSPDRMSGYISPDKTSGLPPEHMDNPFVNPDGRPPDVRPKNPISFPNGNYSIDRTQHKDVPIRANNSCPEW